MLALQHLSFVRELADAFERKSVFMEPALSVQARYIALIVSLRAVGHTFISADCAGSPERDRWRQENWKVWEERPIYAGFIKPTRDQILKDFKGLKSNDPAFEGGAVYGGPTPTIVTDFDASKLRDANGELVMPKIREGINFWNQYLNSAEDAFRRLPR
ncbi:MAG: hypothetical protein K2X57_06680 [Xanthobacteraceae bacterium]|nr:hypothetical protein [Xanthobacteraceae bacterium]